MYIHCIFGSYRLKLHLRIILKSLAFLNYSNNNFKYSDNSNNDFILNFKYITFEFQSVEYVILVCSFCIHILLITK